MKPSHTLPKLPPVVLATLLALAALFLWAAPAVAEYRPLPHAVVLLDSQPVDLGTIVEDAEAHLVPLGKAITVLTRGQLTPDADDARLFRARRGDTVVLEIPTEGENAAALVQGRRVALADTPQRVTLPGQPEMLMMDLKVLAGLLGITMEQEGATFSLWTPEFWCAQVGLTGAAAEQRTLRNLPLLPDMGVSPPAKSLLIWVRPREAAFVQIYKLSGGKPEPLLGLNQFDRPVTHPNPPLGTPRAWSTPANRPVRVDTLFYDEPPAAPAPPTEAAPRYGTYVALVTRREPKNGDVLQAIQSGEIPAEDWSIAGVRQRVVRGVILYEPYAAAENDTLPRIAQRFRMPLAMLEDLNGLRASDPLAPGDKIVVMRGINVGEQQRREKTTVTPTGYYAVLPGDTIAGLARRCGVTEEAFLDANNTLPPGAELEPGEIVTLVKPIRPVPVTTPKPPPPPVPDVQPDFATMVVKKPTPLRKYSVPTAPVIKTLPANQPVTVLAKIPERNQCRVAIGDVIGWVQISDVGPAPQNGPTVPPPTAAEATAGQQVVQEALRWVGVPRYEWGGNQIDRGIDCSHFVAAAYTRSGHAVPSPPVHNMETFGDRVHWKPGPVEEYGRVQGLATSPSIASLRPGDRIIFQNNPTSGRPGNHHTGIYVGAYKGMKHAIVHCNASSNTVSVNELTGRLWNIYRYAVRGDEKRPPGAQTAQSAQGTKRTGRN